MAYSTSNLLNNYQRHWKNKICFCILLEYIGILLIWVNGMTTMAGKKLTNLGEGNGTPLQYSCLENPMDGGA